MERLQKILARAGVASRRASEVLIEQQRVTVNGVPARIGQQADPARDDIRVDGRRIAAAAQAMWVVLHKPPGVVVSDRAQGDRPTARELIGLPQRLFAVGRLDVESEGLVVLTNDGAAAERLAHPRYEHEKEYRVLLNRPPDEDQLASWTRGVVLPDGHRTRPARVWREPGGRSQRWMRLVLPRSHGDRSQIGPNPGGWWNG
jgi:23S rRNA pseudouridine2605 synthase